MSITKIALASARFGTDELALKAAVGDCVYGSNAVDANNGYRCNLEVLHVTLQQLAFCSHSIHTQAVKVRGGEEEGKEGRWLQ
mmetsp:Transcript_30656/g.79841  ORF Transcript_30656/g.79841 Transcript_30656/m.79841 type:complete len:83 (+) Transcript_30656:854-1102(+)